MDFISINTKTSVKHLSSESDIKQEVILWTSRLQCPAGPQQVFVTPADRTPGRFRTTLKCSDGLCGTRKPESSWDLASVQPWNQSGGTNQPKLPQSSNRTEHSAASSVVVRLLLSVTVVYYVCVNTVQRNYFKKFVGWCRISCFSFCLLAFVFLLLLIWY